MTYPGQHPEIPSLSPYFLLLLIKRHREQVPNQDEVRCESSKWRLNQKAKAGRRVFTGKAV